MVEEEEEEEDQQGLTSLSRVTGCRILAKAEHLNPSGSSIKDRAAVYMGESLLPSLPPRAR